MKAAILAVLALIAAAPAVAVPLDPEGEIRPKLLGEALEALEEHPEAKASPRLVVVDYGLHSSKERLFVVDLQTGGVEAFRTSHGAGSDPDHDGYLDSFSDRPGSAASPRGAYLLAEPYVGKHGKSLRLDGLDPTNANARARAIVIHAADYAEPDWIARFGKLGRSSGCIAFARADLRAFMSKVPKGTLIYVGR